MLRYIWLEAKRQWRNREILIFRLGIPAAIYLILVAVQDRPGGAEGGVPWQTGRMVALAGLAARSVGTAGCASWGSPPFGPAPPWWPRSWWP
jgi:hypothetical protein